MLFSDAARDCRVKWGAGLRKDQMLLVQQASGEVVDWPDGAEGHGVVSSPEQVGTKHHSQVTVGHLIHFAVGCHLDTHTHTHVTVGNRQTHVKVISGKCTVSAVPVPGM